jgi:hypothetical protein
MALMTMTGSPRLADPHAPIRVSCTAGAVIEAGDACYIDSAGLAQLCIDSAETIANVSNYEGICLTAAAIGDTITLFGINSKIYMTSTAQTIGSFWFVSATAGKLGDALVSTADTYLPVGKMITAYVMEVVRAGV